MTPGPWEGEESLSNLFLVLIHPFQMQISPFQMCGVSRWIQLISQISI